MRLVLDAGAFIAFERRDRDVMQLVDTMIVQRTEALTHGGVVGQIWRRPGRQVALARLLRGVDVRPLDASLGRDAGRLLAAAGTSDVIDAALVALVRNGDRVVTSDPADIVRLLNVAHLEADVIAI